MVGHEKGTIMRYGYSTVALAGICVAVAASSGQVAQAIVAIHTTSVNISLTPSATINYGWVVSGMHDTTAGTFVGDATYVGTIPGGTTSVYNQTYNLTPGDVTSGGYATLVGLTTQSAGGSTTTDVVLGMNNSAYTTANSSNALITSYIDDITPYLPTSITINGVTVSLNESLSSLVSSKADIVSLLSGTLSANVTVSGLTGIESLLNGPQTINILPYSLSSYTIIPTGTSYTFSAPWSANIATDGIAVNGINGTLVNFDAPTSIGTFGASNPTPEPASMAIFGLGFGALALARRRIMA